jgi:hypothetical protein
MALDPNRPLSAAEIAELKQLFQDLRGIANLDINLFEQSLGSVKAVRQELESLRREQSNLNSDITYFYQQLKKTIVEYSKQNNALNQIKKSYNALDNLVSKLRQDQDGINRLSKKELETIVSKIDLQKKDLEQAQLSNIDRLNQLNNQNRLTKAERAERNKLRNVIKDTGDLLTSQIGGLLELENAAKKRLETEIRINKNLGIAGNFYKGIQKTLLNLGVSSEILNEMNDDLIKLADKGKIGFKELFTVTKKGFKEALKDPMFQFALGLRAFQSGLNDIKKAFEIFKEIDSVLVSNARNIGLSVSQMREMVKQASFVQSPFEQTVFTTQQIAESITKINQQLGLSVGVSAATANEFASMTNSMGLSAEEAGEIYKLSVLNNKTLGETNKIIVKGILATQKATGVQINARQVFQEIGKLNAGITAKFQQNPRLIAEAVSQAKALGTTLEDVDKIGESILNWESSIESELKAELITGRQLNFERARAAALVGDQVALMEEMSQQVGSIEEFQRMNVIAQRSLAEAFGMSREEMADMLRKQEIFNKLGDVSNMSAQEQLKVARERGLSEEDSLVLNLKQQAATEKLAATWDSIKIALADLLTGPLSGLVDMMSFLSRNAWMVYTAIGAMATISLGKTIAGLALMAVQMGLISASAITANAAITFGAGLLIVGAAIAGGLALLSNAKKEATAGIPQMAEGGIVPATAGGQLVTVAEAGRAEAIIPLNSPKANKILGNNNVDLTPMITAINEVKMAVNNLASRPSIAYINGRNAFADSLGKTAALGTSQYQNSYNLA